MPGITVSTSVFRDRPLMLLVAQAFFVGLSFGLLYNVAYTFLVLRFGSAGLRTVYVIVGVTVPFVTLGFNALEERLHLAKTSLIVIAIFTLLFFAAYFALTQVDSPVIIYALMVMNMMGTLYSMMLRGSQAVEIYDARSIKNRYPRITGGEIFAVVLAGLLIGPLTALTGSLERLLLLGGVSMIGALAMVWLIIRDYIAPAEAHHHGHHHEHGHGHSEHGFRVFFAILKKRYTLLVFGFQVIASMTSLLVQYIVYSQAQRFFPTQADMSQFIGLVKAGTTAVSFIFLIFAAGRLLIRFGMPIGLAGSPIGVAAMLAAALVAGMIERTPGQYFFILVVATQFVDYMMYSGFAKTSVQSAFQPLPPKERDVVHTFAQGIGIPVSYGLAGIILVGFSRMPNYSPQFAVFPTLASTAVCGVVGAYLYRAYSIQLRKSLSRRNIGEMELSLDDASTMTAVHRLLEAEDAWIVRSGLDLLENAHHASYEEHLLHLAKTSSNEEVLRDLMERIERRKPEWGREVAEQVLAQPHEETVHAAAIRVLCASVDEPISHVAPYLENRSPEIRSAAVGGLFLYGGINGILQAGNVFNAMISAAEPEDRIEAAGILERSGIRNFYHPLIGLLRDSNEAVVAAALRAARQVSHPALIPEILPWVDSFATRSDALAALVAFGAEIVPWLKRCLAGDREIPMHRALRVIRAMARVPAPEVRQTLVDALMSTGPGQLGAAIWTTLSQQGYQASLPEEQKYIRQLINQNAEKAARIVVADHVLGTAEVNTEPLRSVLQDQYVRQEERIFTLCSLIYNQNDMASIQRKVLDGTAKQKALGNELLDVLLHAEIKKPVMTVLEKTALDDLPAMREAFQLPALSVEEQVLEICSHRELWPESWLHTCGLYVASLMGLQDYTVEDSVLTTIERVMTLKAADIFSSIPDAVLAHIASIGEDVDVVVKETFIRKGDIGDCMYIIRDGKVAVHDETTTFAELGPGQVVGEMAVLDPEPRSAFVTAVEDTSLLKIEKDAFDSVMVDHPGIARGVIHVLCNRLRKSLKK